MMAKPFYTSKLDNPQVINKKIDSLEEKKDHHLLETPADGNCLISSSLVSHLRNFNSNYHKFTAEAKHLFGQDNLPEGGFNSLYNIFSNIYRAEIFENLKPWLLKFREKIAGFIEHNLDSVFSESIANFRDQIKAEVTNHKFEYGKQLGKIKQEINSMIDEKQKSYLKEYEKFIKDKQNAILSDPIKYYLDNLKQDKTWCGSIEIIAINAITGCDVKVYNGNDILKFNIPLFKEENKPDILLKYTNGNHYDCYSSKYTQETVVKNLIDNKTSLINLESEFKMSNINEEEYEGAKALYEQLGSSTLEKMHDSDKDYIEELVKYYIQDEEYAAEFIRYCEQEDQSRAEELQEYLNKSNYSNEQETEACWQ